MLDGQVVLIGILAAHVWLELPEEQDGTELGPVDRLSAGGVQDAVEWVGESRAAILREEWLIEQGGGWKAAATERWLGAELFQNKLFDGVIEHPKTGPDAGPARGARTPSDANPRSEGFVVSLRQTVRNTGIAGNH